MGALLTFSYRAGNMLLIVRKLLWANTIRNVFAKRWPEVRLESAGRDGALACGSLSRMIIFRSACF
jgi:hypothetical protein